MAGVGEHTGPSSAEEGQQPLRGSNIPCWPQALALGSSGLKDAALAADHTGEWHKQVFPVLLVGRE